MKAVSRLLNGNSYVDFGITFRASKSAELGGIVIIKDICGDLSCLFGHKYVLLYCIILITNAPLPTGS